jgi:hypothetical protein
LVSQSGFAGKKSICTRPSIGRAREVHNIWQIDAKEKFKIATGEKHCYLTVVDEKSGSLLGAKSFPYGQISEVPLEEIRSFLLFLFSRWGKCGAVRVDNGLPFGNTRNDCPSSMGLWLLGYNIKLILNPPRSPTENAKVERMQRTSASWCDIHKCKDLADLQVKLDAVAIDQREKYKEGRRKGISRLEEFPELEAKPRVFDAEDFQENLVWDYLAKTTYARKTSKDGRFDILGQKIGIGCKYPHRQVMIRLNTHTKQWEISPGNSPEIIKKDTLKLNKERVLNFTFYERIKL